MPFFQENQQLFDSVNSYLECGYVFIFKKLPWGCDKIDESQCPKSYNVSIYFTLFLYVSWWPIQISIPGFTFNMSDSTHNIILQ